MTGEMAELMWSRFSLRCHSRSIRGGPSQAVVSCVPCHRHQQTRPVLLISFGFHCNFMVDAAGNDQVRGKEEDEERHRGTRKQNQRLM
ncbi:hypothetical protein AKJ16_DCAP06612 [Drosera capensis]